ncbi:MAG: hypothetical protein WC718_01405 [Phycisphaerales bacterium]|jgi:hypothetical protein
MKKSKTKSTTNQTTHMTQTPNNPEWVTSGLQGIGGQINDLSKADPYSFVAGPDALQTQAGASAAGLTTSPNYGRATDILGGVASAGPSTVQAGDIAGGISQFMNPYLKDVVDTSLADYNQGAGYTRAENKLSLAGDSTFGGSGGAIQTMLSNDAIDRGRGTLSAGLRSGAYDRAAALAAQQAQMQQQASLANGQFNEQALSRQGGAAVDMAGIGQAQGADQRSNISTQSSIGDMLQQLAQTRATAPLSLLGTQASLMSGLPLNLLNGQTQDGTMSGTSTSKTTLSDPMSGLGGLLSAGGSLASGLGSLGLSFAKAKGK